MELLLVQLNDAFATVDEIQEFIAAEREARDEKEIPYMTASIKADESVKMGIVTDVKQELRKANALKLIILQGKEPTSPQSKLTL